MEKKEISIEDRKSTLNIENRKKILLTGVVEVVNFNDEQIILNTNLGTLVIKGEGLKMNKLDVQNGDVIVVGMVNSCTYINSQVKHNKGSVISRLFR